LPQEALFTLENMDMLDVGEFIDATGLAASNESFEFDFIFSSFDTITAVLLLFVMMMLQLEVKGCS
jgi:hypothetical protein